ncbi:MAG: transglycosylase domain-containing protein [Clostridia bacterium]|nr:transglycosylase domain-containing protein [Clostridia bacterium]
MKKILKFTAFITSIVIILALFLLLSYFFITKDAMLDKNLLKKSDYAVEVYSEGGNLISTKSSNSSGKYVKITELKAHTKNAFIAIEDRRFYSHNGIDLKRIIGASLNNLKSMSFKEGASTITQQLVKNTHLSSEKTLKRKLSEIKIALELERNYDKDKILELYLNTIYFGKSAYGIEDASNLYFNKSATNLTINESAILAGIIKAPSKYSPIDNISDCFDRKNVVLKAMVDCNFITSTEYDKLKKEKITISTENYKVYDDYVNAVISEYENTKYFTPYSNKKVKITSYLNEELQRDIYQERTALYSASKIVINSKIGGVIAFFGNNSNLKRSPASCVKPWLVYAPMINDGYIKESSVISDEPINYNGYSPKNYGDKYYGNVTVKTALSKSLNVPAVTLLNGYGITKSNRYTTKMGIDISEENLSSALGSLNNGLTLKQLCDAYSPFNNDGNYQKSTFIKDIYIGNVKVYSHKADKTNVFKPETAYIINDILKEAVNNGNSKKLRSLPFEVCAKTGTNGNNNGNFDALSVSYTTDIIVGVWLGKENNELMPNSVTGSNEPTLITKKIYECLYKTHYPKPFTAPVGIVKATIDENYLINEKTELLKLGGTPYYYISGTEPKTEYSSVVYPKLISSNMKVKNGVVILNFTVNNANYIEISKEYNGKLTTVYKGNVISEFTDKLTDFGIYNYKLKITGENNTIDYDFSSINYNANNLEILKDDKWLTN